MKWNLYVYFIVLGGGGRVVVLVVSFIGWYESYFFSLNISILK
jgi:hypothetical protein